ncbi:hypothetical protein FXN61_39685 [Lentzea sp. PSKA42]|jgi:hypothetical protein|uniref:SseB protein N-terminal domain-containing protein n=1 Tax=Lentzea indica TaxID=2604800 RepID=A0ABX1FU08_9PSEU|nr:hypothetical protein [Lentzea indica]NKE62529.1 hypothetical protein [Lentzea indica]
MNLAELVDRTSVDTLDHLERETTVPVVDGLQAQGDLIVIPFSMFAGPPEQNASRWVPAEGIHLVQGADGRNPHVLVADPGTCTWSPAGDPELGLGIVENTAPVYLLHPEHGGTGIAPGRWVVRQQRERTGFVAD